jgi:hypothetical protein
MQRYGGDIVRYEEAMHHTQNDSDDETHTEQTCSSTSPIDASSSSSAATVDVDSSCTSTDCRTKGRRSTNGRRREEGG